MHVKPDSIRSAGDRGAKVSYESNRLFHNFMEQVKNIFKNLPKPLKWRSFFEIDLPILMDASEKIFGILKYRNVSSNVERVKKEVESVVCC